MVERSSKLGLCVVNLLKIDKIKNSRCKKFQYVAKKAKNSHTNTEVQALFFVPI